MQPPPEKRQKLDNIIVKPLLDNGIIKQLTTLSQTTCSMCNSQILATNKIFKEEYGHLIDKAYEAFLLLWHCNTTVCKNTPNGWTYTVLVGNKAGIYVGSSTDVLDRLTAHHYGNGAVVTKEWGGLFGVSQTSATAKLCLHDVAQCLLDLKINLDGLHPETHEENQVHRVFDSLDIDTAKQAVRGGRFISKPRPSPKNWRFFFANLPGRCLFCNEKGHMVRECPTRIKRDVSTCKFIRVGLDEQGDPETVENERDDETDDNPDAISVSTSTFFLKKNTT